MITFNMTPTLAYEVMKGVHVAAGVQLQYLDITFKFQGAGVGGTEVDACCGPGKCHAHEGRGLFADRETTRICR